MPTLRLSTHSTGPVLSVRSAALGRVDVHRPQFRCLLRLPNTMLPRDAVIDTGSPLVCFPEDIWKPFRPGIDFEWLPFDPGITPPLGQVVGWAFPFRMARFLTPITLMDYGTGVDRPDVIAQFASGNLRPRPNVKGLPPVIIGLWGGLLEGGRVAVGRDANGRVAGELEFP